MAFSLESISRHNTLKAPIVVLHGVPGVGKTTFAAGAPNVIFIDIEDGLGVNVVDKFPQPKTFQDVLDCIEALGKGDHDYQWLGIDSLSSMQKLVFDAVCEEHGKNSIEDFGYGKGYVHAMEKFKLFFDYVADLRDYKKMGVVMIAHTDATTFKNPEGDDYDKYFVDLDKRAQKLMVRESDVIGFFNYKTFVKKQESDDRKGKAIDGGRILYLEEKPAFTAKNRYQFPASITIPNAPENPWGPFQSLLDKALSVTKTEIQAA